MIIRRVLIANRGEIAVRVIRTCGRLGITTVLAVCDADAGSVPAALAGETIRIGSYLDADAVVAAALAAGADAIHPGYGFLSENPRLARACEAAGVVFIGPSPEVLEAAGDKLAARAHAVAAGLPVLPGGIVSQAGAGAADALAGGIAGQVTVGAADALAGGIAGQVTAGAADALAGGIAGQATAGDADALARRLGYPVLVKAAGGGGGRGLRVVTEPGRLAGAVAMASAEADAAFGDSRVYLERYVTGARHVEVQLLGDGRNVIHLGDRDCSVQRRYQKVVEEAPAPRLGETLRVGLRAAAVGLGQHLKYQGLGTVEFLVDPAAEAFWFLEVNARIQVEHPVTEMVTGVDLVAEQIAVAEGRGLRLDQAGVGLRGHAIECRINAEDPAAGFRPSPGTVTSAVFPAGPGIRVDTQVQAGSAVPAQYDSLLAKLVVTGADRDQALARLRGALARCRIEGVATNLPLLAALAEDGEFAAGGVDTGYLARWLAGPPGEAAGPGREPPLVRERWLADQPREAGGPGREPPLARERRLADQPEEAGGPGGEPPLVRDRKAGDLRG